MIGAMNKLMIATAGSGKTTKLVCEAYNRKPSSVIILTYTEENEQEIRNKFHSIYKCIPSNVVIQTWFSFLIQHGVKPYQGAMHNDLFSKSVTGLLLVNKKSGIKFSFNKNGRTISVPYSEKDEFLKHYFTSNMMIYSDKLSKFIVKCNKATNGEIADRISRIYKHIFIDEVQDLAGNDFEIVKILAQTNSEVLLAGDPRQVTYLTHHESKNQKYGTIGIKQYILDKCKKRGKFLFEIDETTLLKSHRNNESICLLSSKLYTSQPRSIPCSCSSCRDYAVEHEGIYFVKPNDVKAYLKRYSAIQLKWDKNISVIDSYPSFNFGASKGKTFNRVIIYPTKEMEHWLFNNNVKLSPATRAKFYVAITRARYSVAIIYDYTDRTNIEGIVNYSTPLE